MIFDPATSRLIIHGLGVEGRAALDWFLTQQAQHITVIDRADKFSALPESLQQNTAVTHVTEPEWVSENHDTPRPELYLRSPGIAPDNPVFEKIRHLRIPHTTPTGYWLAKYAPQNTITITGTKGKSSTASLTAHLLRWAGRRAEEMGNIGRTPFEAVISTDTICVLELSSYMMHDLPPLSAFHVVTNIYKEHTDWHGSHSAYRHDKLRPFAQNPPARGIVATDLRQEVPANSAITTFDDHTRIDGNRITFGTVHELTPVDLHPAFAAPSMLLALRASIATCLASGLLTPDQVSAALQKNLSGWPGLPSRQFILPTTDGLIWVDDALATVPEATLSALTRWQGQTIHLLLGGADRGQQFDALIAHCRARANIQLYAFSETASALQAAAESGAAPTLISHHDSLESMIESARHKAREGDIILFSPAAPSARPHANYLERSRIFQSFAPQG
ncbi:UDP-N-acetylmuramoyl-L-alanine--D-glutamate ligase [Parvularcula sp. IMCC14364]|uniref:UDP-N-acetylmuramoyl-L-alanine--D-glutamate ligase n=1 Tax=Parvularcula sp. IMCC14364 TaxID=3067902 RepID=UPI0027412266|nr:UDP-N-acetylmuramoyl-L-alanine--D-glutamate ligase [Parvularcula sp. IMCC14364]